MLALERRVIIGSIVLFLRSGSHAVSFGDSESAVRMVGRTDGQSTLAGA